MLKGSFRRVLSKVWRTTGILAPRRQHLSCFVRSAERRANSWEAARRCNVVVADIVVEGHSAALQRKTWRLRASRGERRNLHRRLPGSCDCRFCQASSGRELFLYNVMR